MRAMLRTVIAALAVLSAMACDRMDTLENYYASYIEASSSGALAYGYLPSFLPTSAQRIHEQHLRKGNDILVYYVYDPKDRDTMIAKCRVLGAADLHFPRMIAEWWPNELKSGQSLLEGYRYFRCEPDGGFLALRESQGLAYYWRM